MIKAVIFDFYGVICSEEYWQSVKRDRDVASGFNELRNELHQGSISWDEFLKQIASKTGKSVKELQVAYEAEKINLPLVTFIAKLHQNYKTGLLSNAAYAAFKPKAEEIGFKELFDATVVSSQIGIIKPDPRIYHYMLKELGVEAEEAVYIDDVSRYTQAAKSLGLETIHYLNFPQMKTELEKILASSDD